MELMTFLIILADWIQSSDTTDCTLYTRPERTMINLHCPNAMCRFQVQNPHGSDCNTNPDGNTPYCYIDDCNGVYNICNISSQNASNDSSSRCRELSSGGQTVYSNEQPINCTVTLIPNMIFLRCRKGECYHTARSLNTTCSRDLGIDCGVGEASCDKTYSLHTATEPPTPTTNELLRNEIITNRMTCTCPECTHKIGTMGFDECTKTVTVQSCAKQVYTSMTKSLFTPTTTYTVIIHSTNAIAYPSPCSPKIETTTVQTVPLTIVALVTGFMVGLIILSIVVTTGWVWTCWTIGRKKNLQSRSQNISATALNLENNPAYEAQTSLQQNPAYEDTTHNTNEIEESQSVTNPAEPTYEIVPLVSTQINTTASSQEHQDAYNRLNREILQH